MGLMFVLASCAPAPDESEQRPKTGPPETTRSAPPESELLPEPPSQSGGEGSPTDGATLLVDTESTEPEVVKVFYGTNRQRLKQSFAQYLTPFVKPLIFLLLLLLIPYAVRAVIKPKFQRLMSSALVVVMAGAFVYYSLKGIQIVAQRSQAIQTLPVQYGPERLRSNVHGLRYELGICEVSIPPTHEIGVVEEPNLLYLEFHSDPTKHFVLTSIEPQPPNEFFSALQGRVETSPYRDIFVFVHGFHNTFQDAAFRTAQIAHDLEFAGAPVFFSWPSQGKILDYFTDANNVGEATEHLKHFLEELKRRTNAQRIHVIAHSMGSRALTDAVQKMGLASDGPVVNEMILAAPDMDADEFRNIARDLTRATDRVTLYASSNDQALAASRKAQGGYARAGESLPVPVTVPPVETIDVSRVSGGHSYIAHNGRVLSDLNEILVRRRKLDDSIADPKFAVGRDNVYWVLKRPIVASALD